MPPMLADPQKNDYIGADIFEVPLARIGPASRDVTHAWYQITANTGGLHMHIEGQAPAKVDVG